jgi:glycosyltransferase involved in cell wall biosynthesis
MKQGAKMARIFFDITDIATYIRFHNSISGIQRATVTIISEVIRQSPANTIYLAWHKTSGSTYQCCPADGLADILGQFDIPALGRILGVRVAAPGPERIFLERYANAPIKQRFHSARLNLAGWLGQRRYFEKRGLDFETWKARRTPETGPRIDTSPFFDTARPADVLCGLGLLWGRPHLEASFRKARAAGINTYVMVYDLVPMKLPDVVDPRFSTSYYDWLSKTPEYVTGYMACSVSTRKDLAEFLEPLQCNRPIHVVPLAQARLQAPATPKVAETIPDAHAAALTATLSTAKLSLAVREAATVPYVLCVGTIEPRKNLWRLVQVWKRLARDPELNLPRLVLAGKRGWLVDSFLEVLRQTGGFDGWVTYLEAPSDHELDFLYRNCLFTTTVSLYEGWGLPIGEGLSYGKTGVLSHISSLPEVGGDMVEYCDPTSLDDMAGAFRRLIAEPDHRADLEARIRVGNLRSWDHVGRDVLSVLHET